MQYTETQNRLGEAVLTSTHNLCFGAKKPCKPQFFYIKVGFKGVYITRTCFHYVILIKYQYHLELFSIDSTFICNIFQNDTIDPSKFTFEDFFTFYRHLVGRTEVDKVFDEM